MINKIEKKIISMCSRAFYVWEKDFQINPTKYSGDVGKGASKDKRIANSRAKTFMGFMKKLKGNK